MEKINPMETGFSEKNQRVSKLNRQIQLALFIFIIGKSIVFLNLSPAHMVKYLLLVVCIVFTTIVTEFIYYFIVKKTTVKDIVTTIKITNPLTLGLTISCAINYGYNITPVVVCTILAMITCRLVYGGYTNNLFDAFAFTMVILHSCFGSPSNNNIMSGRLDSYLLDLFNAQNVYHLEEIANLKDIITLEVLPYISLINFLLLISVIVYFVVVVKKLGGEIAIFVRILIFLAILCYSFVGFLNGTSHLEMIPNSLNQYFVYSINLHGVFGHFYKTLMLLFYMLYGATIFGVILCTVFTNSMPKSNTSKYLVAFFIAVLIFYTKIFTYNSFGVFYAVILANALTPMLDSVVRNSESAKNHTVIFLVVFSLVIGFIAFSFAMRGV